MRRRTVNLLLLATCSVAIGPGAAPQVRDGGPPPPNASKAASSFHAVTKAIDEAIKPWEQPGATAPPAAPGWREFFGALKAELGSYSAATDDHARLTSLGRLHQMDLALWGVAWGPAVQVRSALDEWLTPRVRIAWAERRLFDYVEAHRNDSPGSTEHSKLWKTFVDDELGSALAAYEGAKTVQARRAALKRLTGVLASLRRNNQSVAWTYSYDLQAAIDGLYNLPNLDVSADVASVSPFLSNNVIQPEILFRGGYRSVITPGPKTGFGLLPSDEGIAFYNSQLGSTYTPVTDFQQQLQQDQRGRKVAKLYTFAAQTYDTPNVTVTAIIRPSTGLTLWPASSHAVRAAFEAYPNPGKGLARGVLAIIGLNREKLTEKVGQQALPKMASGVEVNANEEAWSRIPGAEAEQNAKLRKVLVGGNTAVIKEYRITDLSFRSRSENALVSGKVGHTIVPDAIGADMPQPSSLVVPSSGVSADVHLGSVLSNVVAGLLDSEEVRGVDNVMIVTKAVQPGAPPKEGVTVGKNVDFDTFLKSIAEARAANNPNVTALRIKKPTVPPEFAADERGFLVIMVRDFQMDVPAPPGAENGGILGAKARVLRFLVPTAEFVLSYKVPATNGTPPTELDAKVEDFVHSTNSKVQTLFDDETKPTTMGPFQANLALLGFKNKLQQVPIKVPLTSLNIPGFSLTGISSLDPSGWMRVVLMPNGQPINLQPKPAPAPAPAVATTPGPTPSVAVPAATLPTAAVSPSVAR